MEVDSFYGDYKKLDSGIYYAMTTTSGWGESEITKLDINPKIDESIFSVSK